MILYLYTGAQRLHAETVGDAARLISISRTAVECRVLHAQCSNVSGAGIHVYVCVYVS
jgi:hypothetical protein